MSEDAAIPGAPLAAPPNRQFRIGIVASLILLLAAFVSLVWTPHPLGHEDIAAQMLGPSLLHPLGTDTVGRDGLSLVMKGMLTSYVVGAIAVAIGLFLGVPLGLAAATNRPAARIVSGVTDFVATVPALAVAAAFAALAGPGPANAMVAIGVALVPVFARVTWLGVATLARSGYVAAARLGGMSYREAAARHVFPVLLPLLMAQALASLGFAVIAETVLSYAGLGAQASGMSLGLVLRQAQANVLFGPTLMIGAGIAAVAIAAMLHLAADGLRRTLPPELGELERDDALA